MTRTKGDISHKKILEIKAFVDKYISSTNPHDVISVKGLFQYDKEKFNEYTGDKKCSKITWIGRIERGAYRHGREASRELPEWSEVMKRQPSSNQSVNKHTMKPTVIPADDFDELYEPSPTVKSIEMETTDPRPRNLHYTDSKKSSNIVFHVKNSFPESNHLDDVPILAETIPDENDPLVSNHLHKTPTESSEIQLTSLVALDKFLSGLSNHDNKPPVASYPVENATAVSKPVDKPPTISKPVGRSPDASKSADQSPTVSNPDDQLPITSYPIENISAVSNPVGKLPTISKRVGRPSTVSNPDDQLPITSYPIESTSVVSNPVGKPPTISKRVGRPPTLSNPDDQLPITSYPIENVSAVSKPVGKPPTISKRVGRPPNASKSTNKPPAISRPLGRQRNASKPGTRPPNIPRPVGRPPKVSKLVDTLPIKNKSVPVENVSMSLLPFKRVKDTKYAQRPSINYKASVSKKTRPGFVVSTPTDVLSKPVQEILSLSDTIYVDKVNNKPIAVTLSDDYQTILTADDLNNIEKVYKRISKKDKIILSTNTIVEDTMKNAAERCHLEHPVHSLILDLEDVLWDDEERFTEDEKEEILNIAPNELLNEANEELSNIFSILNGKTSFNDLFNAIDNIEAHPHKTPKLYWIKESLMNSLRLFNNSSTISLSSFSNEKDILNSVFGFIEKIKYVLNLVSESDVESYASLSRKKIGSDSKSKISGDISNLTLKYNSVELLCVKIGLNDNGILYTKYLNERYLKIPKMLKDFLCEAVDKYPQTKSSIKPMGFIINGFAITGIYQECTRGSASIIKESARLHFPQSLSEFVVKIKPIIHLLYNSINIMENNIKSCTTDNNDYSLGKRKCSIPPCYTPKRSKCN